MGCHYSKERKEINAALKPMRAWPNNAAMQGIGCEKLLKVLHKYEAPHVVIKLMGKKTVNTVCHCIKTHHHSGIVMRPATNLLKELLKNEHNMKRVRKAKILHQIHEIQEEFFQDPELLKTCDAIEAGLRGVHTPLKTLAEALEANDADLALLVMRWHPKKKDVQADALRTLVNIAQEDASSIAIMEKRKLMTLIAAALEEFKLSNSVQANGAALVYEACSNEELRRSAGRDGVVEALGHALRSHLLWRETHQQALWALGKLADAPTNLVHMKRAKVHITLRELKLRKEAAYVLGGDERAMQERRAREAAEEAERKRTYRAEDEYERASEHVDFDFLHEDKKRNDQEEGELTGFDRYLVTVGEKKLPEDPNKNEYKSRAQMEKEEAKRKRMAMLLGKGEEAKQKAKSLQAARDMEFEGVAQEAALFVPKKLRAVNWQTVNEAPAVEYLAMPDADQPVTATAKPQEPTYKDTLETLLGPRDQWNTRRVPRKERVQPKYLEGMVT